MKNIINKRWFNQPKRHDLAKYVQDELNKANMNLVDYSLYAQPNQDVSYKVSALGAWVTVLHIINYLAVDPTGRKPWVIRKAVKQPLELKQFKEYIVEIVDWLNYQPPNPNYSALVYTQAVINFLTTMEFENGR